MNDVIRRDPRTEWIARNRLHPRHAEVLAALGDEGSQGGPAAWMGPAGLMRRNPHAEGFIGPNGVKRIDRSGARTGAAGQASRHNESASRLRHVVVDTPAFLIAVVPDLAGGRLSSHDRDLLGLARQLADADSGQPGAVLAIVFGSIKETAFGEAGVDRLLHLQAPILDGYAPEARLSALRAVEREFAPRHWLLPDSPLGGAELGRRLAVRLALHSGERPATQVWQVEAAGTPGAGAWQCTGRGAAGRTDITRRLPRVVLVQAECAEPVNGVRHEARSAELSDALDQAPSRLEDLGAVAVDPASVALSEAEFILSAGNGVKDWDGFHHAARVLGATEGASRVAVDDGFMARDRQVGASGTWVTARVYVAVGISGAIQHLQGIQRCDKVVAINFDPGCDMVKRADLSVIGDSGAILAALAAKAAQARGETPGQQPEANGRAREAARHVA